MGKGKDKRQRKRKTQAEIAADKEKARAEATRDLGLRVEHLHLQEEVLPQCLRVSEQFPSGGRLGLQCNQHPLQIATG